MEIHSFCIEKEVENERISIWPTIIRNEDKVILIDCGYEETVEELKQGLSALGFCLSDITILIISHDDIDHLGAVTLLLHENPTLKIYCSEKEAPSITGQKKSERLIQAETLLKTLPENSRSWAVNFIRRLKNIKRTTQIDTFDNEIMLASGIEIIETPGHTRGHISVWCPRRKILVANDAIVIEDNKFEIANPNYTLDLQEAINSVIRIRKLKPESVLCYHGGVMHGNIDKKLKDLIDRYSKIQSLQRQG